MSGHEYGRKQGLVVPEQRQKRGRSNGDRRTNMRIDENARQPKGAGCAEGRPRVFVAAENRLLREALSRMLAKGGNIEVAGVYGAGPFRTEDLLKEEANILLLTSRGSMNEDLAAIRMVRASAPKRADFTDRRYRRRDGVSAVRAGRCPRVPSEKRLSGGRCGRGAGGASGRGRVSWHPLRVAFPLF